MGRGTDTWQSKGHKERGDESEGAKSEAKSSHPAGAIEWFEVWDELPRRNEAKTYIAADPKRILLLSKKGKSTES